MLLMLRLMLELWVGICFRVVQTHSIVINLTNIIFRIICNVGFALNQFGGGALLHLYYTSSVSFSQYSLLFLKMLMIECTWCSVPQYLLQYSHSLHFLSPFLNYPFFIYCLISPLVPSLTSSSSLTGSSSPSLFSAASILTSSTFLSEVTMSVENKFHLLDI